MKKSDFTIILIWIIVLGLGIFFTYIIANSDLPLWLKFLLLK